METRVELINNPYMQRLCILINEEAVSVYSNLEKYMDEPFCYWCDRILDDIYEECNRGVFRLHFRSRREELEIMEKLVRNYPYCVQYSSSPFVRPTSLLDRIKGLNGLIRDIGDAGCRTFDKKALFILPENMKWLENDLKGLEVKNSFCQIKAAVTYYQEYLQKRENGDVIFLFSNGKAIEESMRRLNIDRDFGIFISDRKAFQQKKGQMFIYESREDTIFETIFDCLLLSPLLDAFCSCIHSLPAETAEKYKEKIEELQSISVKVIPCPESTAVEVGRSSRIRFKSDLEGYEIKVPQLHYSYSEKGIIRCNGILVEGIKAGKATLFIYREGEQIPCANVEYTVIKRNRITELRLEDDCIEIGEGDQIRLEYDFLPVNADNEDTIEFESDNSAVAAVDKYGNLRAVGRGVCTVRCYAEQVSAGCRCIVKPHLKSVVPEAAEITMVYGQEQEIKIKLSPANCIDDQMVFSSMDMQIVNVVGRKAKAVGVGNTRIIIQNREETVRAEIAVCVMAEKELNEMEEQSEKNTDVKSKKKSWLSRLFH